MDIKSLYVIGDSISIQYGPYLKSMLGDRLKYDRPRRAGESVEDLHKPVGDNGGDSAKVLSLILNRYASHTCAGKPQAGQELLMLNCGLHDIKLDIQTGRHQIEPDQYRRNLIEAISAAHRARCPVVWVRTTPVDDERHNAGSPQWLRHNSDVIRYNSIADSVAAEHRLPVLDLYSFTVSLGSDVYCDDVHFTEEVRRLQAAYIVGSLRQILASRAYEDQLKGTGRCPHGEDMQQAQSGVSSAQAATPTGATAWPTAGTAAGAADEAVSIRAMTPADYDEVLRLWQSCDGIGLSSADSRENITQYLDRNPGMSFVAERQGEIIGAVLCGHDGRRGLIHHMAVAKHARRQGIGAALEKCCIDSLCSVGIGKCHIMVMADNAEGAGFWRRLGWQDRTTIRLMSKDVVG